MLGLMDLLRLTELSEEQEGLLRVMHASAEGLMQVLNEILDFSRIEAGKFSLEIATFSAADLLHQVPALAFSPPHTLLDPRNCCEL